MSEKIVSEVEAMVKEIKKLDFLDPDTNIVDEGIVDSFDIMQIVSHVAERFGVVIGGNDLTPSTFTSVRSLAAFIQDRKQ